MDFSNDQRFNAQKAGGIGVVAMAHVILGGALIYCLHSTIVTVSHETIIDVAPPTPPVVHPVDPVPTSDPHVKQVEVYIPPVEIPNAPQPPIPPIAVSTPIEPPATAWKPTPPTTDTGGGGTGRTTVHTSSVAISDLEKCKPTYSNAAIKLEEEGTTRLKLEVGANNQLVGASIVKSSGFADLDRAAIRALSQCEFKAATQDGTPVQSSLVTDYVWSLQQ